MSISSGMSWKEYLYTNLGMPQSYLTNFFNFLKLFADGAENSLQSSLDEYKISGRSCNR